MNRAKLASVIVVFGLTCAGAIAATPPPQPTGGSTPAQVYLSDLSQTYDGSPKSVTVKTDPPNLNVYVTYNGDANPPTDAGSYAVSATVSDGGYSGSAKDTFTINPAEQNIYWDPVGNHSLDQSGFYLHATADSDGPVTFTVDSGPATIDGDFVTLTATGTVTIHASQKGTNNYAAADDYQSFEVTPAPTVTTVSSSYNPAPVGQTVTLQAHVEIGSSFKPNKNLRSVAHPRVPGGGPPMPTGIVQFQDGGQNIGEAVSLDEFGNASLDTSTLSVGTHTISAGYSGDTNYQGSGGELDGGQVIQPGTNADLSALSLSKAALSPDFDPAFTNYYASVPNGVTSIRVTPTAADPKASGITVNNFTVASGETSDPISLNTGDNEIDITVTAQDPKNTKTYIIIVTRAQSSDAYLSSLVLSAGTLSPDFWIYTNKYTASVDNATSSITVRPTVDDKTASVTVNGLGVTSGSESAPIQLAVGNNEIDIVVTAEDSSQNTYVVNVNRAPNSNADLANLGLSEGTLTPGFDPATIKYSASVGNKTSSIIVTPTVAYTGDGINRPAARRGVKSPKSLGGSTVTVNGFPVASGASSNPISLDVGENNITIVVTAEDGVTTKTYYVVVNRADVGNTAPQITAATGLTSQQGSPSSNLHIATVYDEEGDSVIVTLVGNPSSNGVTLSNLAVDANGLVTADIVADCTASSSSFTLQADDGISTSTASIQIDVTDNSPPVVSYDEIHFVNRTTQDGLSGNVVNAVVLDGDKIYVGTGSNGSDGGLSISEDGGKTFTNRTTANGMGWNTVNDILVNGSEVAVSYRGAGASGYSISTDGGQTFVYRTGEDGLDDNFGKRGIFSDGSALYAATSNGLSISADGGKTFVSRTTANGLGSKVVHDVFADGRNIYAATENGLSMSHDGGEHFRNFTTRDGLGSDKVNAVVASGTTIYAGTDGGFSIRIPVTSAIIEGGARTFAPTETTDNGTIVSYGLQSHGTFTGAVSVDPANGNVSLTNAGPVGTHTITVRATDNCGAITDATLAVHVVVAPQVVSTKNHGSAGPVDLTLPLNGTPAAESRSGGPANAHHIVFRFATQVSVASASLTSGTGNVSTVSGNGTDEVTVDLTGVANAQTIRMTLSGVNDGGYTYDVPVSIAFLLGDIDGDGRVNSVDISMAKSESGQAVDATNFRTDVNADGSLNSGDISLVKSKSGTALP